MKTLLSVLCLLPSVLWAQADFTLLASQPRPPTASGSACDSVNDAYLAAYWKFEESSGSRADSKGSSTLTQVGTVGSGAAIIGNGLSTDHSAAYLTMTTNGAVTTTGSFTIACWAKLNHSQAVAGLVDKALDFKLWLNTGAANPVFRMWGPGLATASTAQSSVSISVGTWYFVVAWYDDAAKKTWISVNNETPVAGGTFDGFVNYNSSVAVAIDGQVDYLDGAMDELFITKRLLTAGERTALYNSGAGCRPSGL